MGYSHLCCHYTMSGYDPTRILTEMSWLRARRSNMLSYRVMNGEVWIRTIFFCFGDRYTTFILHPLILAWQDFNPRSPVYKTGALSTMLQAIIGLGRIELPFLPYQSNSLPLTYRPLHPVRDLNPCLQIESLLSLSGLDEQGKIRR